ncbi:MAG: hypothetical protein ABR543_18095 [Gemmatimonadaceae bacterium]
MRLELVPLIIGLAVGVMGLLLLADAVLPDSAFAGKERRRRERPQRNRAGAAILGLGILCVAAAFIGGDEWRYTTLSVVVAVVLVAAGVVLNWKYLRGLLFGPVVGRVFKRRAEDTTQRTPPEPKARFRLR